LCSGHVSETAHELMPFHHRIPGIQCHIRHWLTQGVLCHCPTTAETGRNLLALNTALWQFAITPGLEPTNNAAERALPIP
jgi:transposase